MVVAPPPAHIRILFYGAWAYSFRSDRPQKVDDVSTLLILLANCSTRSPLPHHPFKSREARLGKRFFHEPVPHAHEVDCRRGHDMLKGGFHLPDIAGSS